MRVDISITCADWRTDLPDAEAVAARVAEQVGAGAGMPLAATEVSLLLSDDDTVRGLNRQWRGRDAATNVLSFPAVGAADLTTVAARAAAGDYPLLLGDVVLAHGVVRREAAAQGKPFRDHVSHLLVHGLLHLLGFDHETDADAAVMEPLEVGILAGLGISDPYAGPPAAHVTIDGLSESR